MSSKQKKATANRMIVYLSDLVSQNKGIKLVNIYNDKGSRGIQDYDCGGLPSYNRLRQFRAGNMRRTGDFAKLKCGEMVDEEVIMKEVREYARFMFHVAPGLVGITNWKERMFVFNVEMRPKFNDMVNLSSEAWALLNVENRWKTY